MTIIPPVIQAKIFSTIGNPSSIIPLGIKDFSNASAMTAGSYITGKEEGTDRCIDEFGSEALWLFGIPFFKGVINTLGYMPQGLDYNFDSRNFRNPKLQELIKKYAPDELKDKINKIYANESKYRKLATAKFLLSVGLAIATYISLTKFKQRYTDKNIVKNILEEYKQSQQQKTNNTNSEVTEQEINSIVEDIIEAEEAEKEQEDKQEDKQEENSTISTASEKQSKSQAINSSPSFTGGFIKAFQDFAIDPVKNMWCLDLGITTERIADSRGAQERWGYAFKEGTLLFFMYYAGNKLEQMLENRAKKVYNKTIKFDARVIENPKFKQAFENNSIEKDLEAFAKVLNPNIEACKDKNIKKSLLMDEEVKLYDFIHNNKNNLVVKTAMDSDIIQPYKKLKKNLGIKDILKFSFFEDTGKIDTRKYIDMETLKSHYQHLKTLLEEYKTRPTTETSDAFFGKLKHLKRGAIINNIGIGILVLGIITPTVMVVKRLLSPGDKEFCRKKQIRERMIKQGTITDYTA